MRRVSTSRSFLVVVFLMLLPGAYILAEDATPEPPEATEPVDVDRELLVDTLLRYEPEAFVDARGAVEDARHDLETAIEGGDAAEIEAREKDLGDAEAALETAGSDYEDAIRKRVYGDPDDPDAPALTDAQVAALNQSLHNTRSNGRVPAIGPEELDEIIAGMFDDKQIRAFTKAYEEEAKFLAKADRFDEGSKQHDKAIDRAEQQKSKFLEKVARIGAKNDADAPPDQTTEAAAFTAHQQAKAAARAAARDSARRSAKQLARAEARNDARKLARQLAKDERKSSAKGLAKGKNK